MAVMTLTLSFVHPCSPNMQWSPGTSSMAAMKVDSAHVRVCHTATRRKSERASKQDVTTTGDDEPKPPKGREPQFFLLERLEEKSTIESTYDSHNASAPSLDTVPAPDPPTLLHWPTYTPPLSAESHKSCPSLADEDVLARWWLLFRVLLRPMREHWGGR